MPLGLLTEKLFFSPLELIVSLWQAKCNKVAKNRQISTLHAPLSLTGSNVKYDKKPNGSPNGKRCKMRLCTVHPNSSVKSQDMTSN
jgi:hypothetical protein